MMYFEIDDDVRLGGRESWAWDLAAEVHHVATIMNCHSQCQEIIRRQTDGRLIAPIKGFRAVVWHR